MLKEYHSSTVGEVGIDEAGRGCLFGPVCIGAVVMKPEGFSNPPYEIKDSKKLSAQKRKILRGYIERHSLAYSVAMIHPEVIDQINILQATMKGMHECLDDLCQRTPISHILVDGTYFTIYTDKDSFEAIPHDCIQGGDNKYQSIAAASILAKEYRDEYIQQVVSQNPELQGYGIHTNKGYGTKIHINALYESGITEWHRKSFEPCKSLLK